jgi:glycosyltransferase involved in cell wall biosynthesis
LDLARGLTTTFTIITANFNSGEKLRATAASVLGQQASLRDDQVRLSYIIMDGASTDGSLSIARELAADHPDVVQAVSARDRGIYDAMNKAVAIAGGRYLYFLGAGDIVLPGVFATVEKSLPPHDRGFLYGDVLWDGRRYDGPFDASKICYLNICHQAIFYGRDALRACGPFDLRFRVAADWDLNMQCFARREIIKQYLPIPVALYEGGGFSTTPDPVFEPNKAKQIRKHFGLAFLFRRWLKQKRKNVRYRLKRRRREVPGGS